MIQTLKIILFTLALLDASRCLAQAVVEQKQQHSSENFIIDSLQQELQHATTAQEHFDIYDPLIRLLRYRSDSTQAYKITHDFLALSRNEKYVQGEMLALKYMADIHEHHGRITESIASHLQSLEIAVNTGDSAFACLVYGDLAYTYTNQDNYRKALHYQQRAMDFAEGTDNELRKIWLHFSLAQSYSELKDTVKAEEQLKIAIEKALALKDERMLRVAYQTAGDHYLELKSEPVKAMTNFRIALQYAHRLDDQLGIADISFSLAKCYHELNRFDSAVVYAQDAIFIWKAFGQRWSVPYGYTLLGEAELEQGNLLQAISSLDSCEQYFDIVRSNQVLMEYYHIRSRTFLAQNDTINAFKSLQQYHLYKDSLNAKQHSESLLEMKVKYEMGRKEQVLIHNKLVLEQQIKANTQKNVLLWVIGCGLVLVCFLLLLVFRNSSNRKKTNVALTQQKAEIEAKDREKTILLKEIHHRVKNNLQVISSLLSLQSTSIKNPDAIRAIQHSRDRVKSISLIHQKLYQHEDLSAILMNDYIVHLTDHLKHVYNMEHIAIESCIVPADFALNIDSAIPIGLILNELITNAFKYAYNNREDGHLYIGLNTLENNKIKLIVSDDGPDWSEGIPKTSGSLGMRLINELSRKVNGTVSWNTNNGTAFTLLFDKRPLN